MKVEISSRLNGYRINSPHGEFAVRNVVWDGLPVDPDSLTVEVSNMYFEENTMHIET